MVILTLHKHAIDPRPLSDAAVGIIHGALPIGLVVDGVDLAGVGPPLARQRVGKGHAEHHGPLVRRRGKLLLLVVGIVVLLLLMRGRRLVVVRGGLLLVVGAVASPMVLVPRAGTSGRKGRSRRSRSRPSSCSEPSIPSPPTPRPCAAAAPTNGVDPAGDAGRRRRCWGRSAPPPGYAGGLRSPPPK
eukprot:CAMPEP_0172576946 /NCGR_PEP_ID=MMETSP1067-20121228/137983_1 /TAXON_ID=265564 ORGANISM="Thalassiosira punctigera, Strain Tpunct2005C2" /NCGR_SAMPLE_ID=MMETSP1067 /ASSEMBLY_ACC=CAM_ASM_000444 /LENGTH=186 /DNA_ID=CAMNT_0013369625 /DNA_START=102 /DNA_END=662 /DNA_ORIENTATION=+